MPPGATDGGSSPVEGVSQAKGMRSLRARVNAYADAGAGLIGKAKQPQGTSRDRKRKKTPGSIP